MPISNLLFYKILFMAEILLAEFLFTFHLKKRRAYGWRVAGGAVAALVLSAVFPVPVNNLWYSSVMFLLLFSSTVPILMFCLDEPFPNIFFCAIASYTTQHFAYEVANILFAVIALGRSPLLGMYNDQIVNFWTLDKLSVFYILGYLLMYLLAYSIIYVCFGKRIQKGKNMRIRSLSLLLLIGAGLLTNIICNSLFTYNGSDDFVSSFVISVMNLLCCLLLLYSQFSLLLTKEIASDLELVRRMWRLEKEQYAISKENIDLINLKCHDMRHQIREIGRSQSFSNEVIEEIEKSILLYDATVKTGNNVLDIILTEKNLRCHSNGIVLTCIADGALLNFMNASELYSLFGNALDNAIESVLKIEDSESRIIGLKVRSIGQLISVNMKNSYTGEIKFDDNGFPVTTKGDSDYHGYGVKSMSYIVDKYDGNLTVSAKDGVFDLNIMLPLPPSAGVVAPNLDTE